MVSLELASMLAFFAIVGMLLYRDRKNLEFSYGIILKRWNKGKEIIDRIVSGRRKFIAYTGTIGVIVGFVSTLIGLYFMTSCAFFPQLLPPGIADGKCFKLVLPSVSGLEKYYPQQVFGIPFWYWLASLFIIIVFHESMHAVYARLEKVPVKSYGIVFLLALPIGAFVDPDTKKLKKLGLFKKLRIYAAGSFGNLVLAAIVIGLLYASNYANAAMFEQAGVKFNSTDYNSPAYNASLSGVIYVIGNTTVRNVVDVSKALSSVRPNDTLTINTTTGIYGVRAAPHPLNASRAYIGIMDVSTVYKYKVFFQGYLPDILVGSIVAWQTFLVILIVLSIGVGIANMLPLLPFDGGLIIEDIFTKYAGKKRGRRLAIATSLIIFALLLINLFVAPIKLF